MEWCEMIDGVMDDETIDNGVVANDLANGDNK